MANQGLGSFADALLQPSSPVPEGVINPDGVPATKRFDVYRNNVVVSLIDALANRYPIIQKLVGEGFFRAMAREFVTAHPPTSPVMLGYGKAFPNFLDSFSAVASLPYLSDVARLESARRTAYHAVDATPIAPTMLEAIPPEQFESVTFETHPSLTLIQSKFAVKSIWHANSQDTALEVPIATPESVMICRPQMDVEVRSLPDGAFAFLTEVENGRTLGEAAQAGLLASPVFDLANTLTGVLAAQIFTRFQLK